MHHGVDIAVSNHLGNKRIPNICTDELGAAHAAQHVLARRNRIHGDDAARTARDVSLLLFDRKADPRALSPSALQVLREEIPFRRLAAVREVAVGTGDGVRASVLDMLVETGLSSSKGDARRQLQQGAVTVNGRRLSADEQSVDANEAIAGVYYLLRKGAREMALVEIS